MERWSAARRYRIDLLPGHFVQELFPERRFRLRAEEFLARGAEVVYFFGELGAELLFKQLPKPLREGRTFSICRYSDLQVSAANHRSVKEVAVRRIIHGIAEYMPAAGFAEYEFVDGERRGGSDYERLSVEIRRREFSSQPIDRTGGGQFLKALSCSRRYDVHERAGFEQALDLAFTDPASAHH